MLDELTTGPLGLSFNINSNIKNNDDSIPADLKETLPPVTNIIKSKGHDSIEQDLDFLLQIDGIGSFLVMRKNSITVGPISSSKRPDIGLIADPNLPIATIERNDEDYFLRSSGKVRVNDVAAANKLLVDSDRISLSMRCSMKFRIPNPASTTANLALSGTRLSRGDIGQIILMDRDILIGPGSNNHIVAENLDAQVTVFAQNNGLICRARQEIMINDVPAGRCAELALDKQIESGQ